MMNNEMKKIMENALKDANKNMEEEKKVARAGTWILRHTYRNNSLLKYQQTNPISIIYVIDNMSRI